ncbi:MAG: SDR family NAD(P)-dependent oxidoreductase [Pseudomonadota bacterium]
MGALAPGNRALVTGAARGIGLAICHRLRAMGLEPIPVDLPGEMLEQARAEFGTVEAVDVADWAQMEALAARVGPIDLLVNNAATRAGRGFDAPLEAWQAAMDVNFFGVVHGVRAFLPGMQTRGSGAIVAVGSKQGITNPPGHPIYNASKAALKSYAEGLAHDLIGSGVSVHLLIPGFTKEAGPEAFPGAWSPDQVAEAMVSGVAAGDFYILCPDNEVTTEMDHKRIRWAAGDITENRPPEG